MTDHVERNQEWAILLRAELRSVWDGYDPKLFPTVHGEQVPTPGPAPAVFLRDASYLDALEAQRAARRAELANRRTFEDGRSGVGAAEGTEVPTSA